MQACMFQCHTCVSEVTAVCLISANDLVTRLQDKLLSYLTPITCPLSQTESFTYMHLDVP